MKIFFIGDIMSNNFDQNVFSDFIKESSDLLKEDQRKYLSIIDIQNDNFNTIKNTKIDSQKLIDKKNDVIILENYHNIILDIDKLKELTNMFTFHEFDMLKKIGSTDLRILHEIQIIISDYTNSLYNSVFQLFDSKTITDKTFDTISIEISAKKRNLLNLLISFHEKIIDKIKYLSNEFENPHQSDIAKNELDLLLKRFNNQTSSMLDSINHKFNNLSLDVEQATKINILNKENNETISSKFSIFDNKINNYESNLLNILHKKNDDFNVHFEKIKTESNNEIDNFKASAQEIIEGILKTHTDFKNLVQNAGIYNLTKNYKDKADEEKIEYKDYRKYTAWSIMAAIASTLIIFIIAFIEHLVAKTPTDTNYLLLVSRLSISAMFFILALYLSKQAAKHYECFQENHKTFLQLAALEPFIGPMNDDDKLAVRKSLIPSYFNQNNNSQYASKGDEVDMSMMFTFMDRLSNFSQNKKDTKPAESTTTETKA